MSSSLKVNPDDLDALKIAFALFDQNSDGRLSKTELQTMLKTQEFNMTDSEALMFFYIFESDANGTIDFNQFTKIASGDFDCDMKIFAKNLFKDLDADKDGFISFDEFQNAKDLLPGLPSELKEAFDEADMDKDGKLSLQEFIKALDDE